MSTFRIRRTHRVRVAARLYAPLMVACSLLGALTVTASGQSPRATATRSACPACQNFYLYANRAWLDSASIPPASSEWGVWSTNDTRVLTQLHAILESAAKDHSHRSASERLLGTFDASCMDSARAEREGAAPLRPLLARIDAMRNPADVAGEMGRLHRDGVRAVFAFSSDVDRVGELRYAARIEAGTLTLSNPQEYLRTDSAAVEHRAAYVDHIARTFVLAGESPAAARGDAQRVVSIESALAAASMTRTQEANASLGEMYRHSSLAALKAITPGFAWDAYFRERRVPPLTSLIVARPEFLTTVARLVTGRPTADWRAYLRWRVLATASPFLSSAFVNEDFHFAQQRSGVVAQTPRWQRCARETGADLPELLGRAYVAHTFSPASKARIDTMVVQIRAVLVERIRTVPWLTEATRRQSLEKARTFGVKIAYPEQWHDYSSLRITPGAFIAERTDARRFESDRLMARIGQRPNRAQWDFHDQYYFVPQSPTAWANWNEIIFPAAYLQPPMYDSTADLATNYGAIGVVIGHEMTHLFTADGGDIDGAGRIRHWWTPTDSARFAVIQQQLVRQYDRYTILDSTTHVNGELTLGENLADLGGVELAYAAMERALASRTPRADDATTPEERFFLAYAHFRASKARPEYVRRRLESDGHAPSMFRVNGPFSNFAPFCETFHCMPGDAMMRPDSTRVQIW